MSYIFLKEKLLYAPFYTNQKGKGLFTSCPGKGLACWTILCFRSFQTIHFHFRLSPLQIFGRLIIQVANPDYKIYLLCLYFIIVSV